MSVSYSQYRFEYAVAKVEVKTNLAISVVEVATMIITKVLQENNLKFILGTGFILGIILKLYQTLNCDKYLE